MGSGHPCLRSKDRTLSPSQTWGPLMGRERDLVKELQVKSELTLEEFLKWLHFFFALPTP